MSNIDQPSDANCRDVNPVLWATFCAFFRERFGDAEPEFFWSEADVVRFCGRLSVKDEIIYLNEASVEASYYQQFG